VRGFAEPFSDTSSANLTFGSNYNKAMLQHIVFKPLIACDTFYIHPEPTPTEP
jgi:hypothetical protein